MIITNAKYEEHLGEKCGIEATTDGEVCHIPLDPANRHYAEITRQVEAGTLTIALANEE